HDPGGAAIVDNLDESNQLVARICRDKITAIKIRTVLPPDGVEILAVMPKRPSLPNRRLVVNVLDAPYDTLVELNHVRENAATGRSATILARGLRQLPPPLSEVARISGCHVIPLEVVRISWSRIINGLRERQNVCAQCALRDSINQTDWVQRGSKVIEA